MNKKKIAVIGLGYVGLPLAVDFAKKFPVISFDINQSRVDELIFGHDSTLEVEDDNLQSVLKHEFPREERSKELTEISSCLSLTTDPGKLENCSYYIITVPSRLLP